MIDQNACSRWSANFELIQGKRRASRRRALGWAVPKTVARATRAGRVRVASARLSLCSCVRTLQVDGASARLLAGLSSKGRGWPNRVLAPGHPKRSLARNGDPNSPLELANLGRRRQVIASVDEPTLPCMPYAPAIFSLRYRDEKPITLVWRQAFTGLDAPPRKKGV